MLVFAPLNPVTYVQEQTKPRTAMFSQPGVVIDAAYPYYEVTPPTEVMWQDQAYNDIKKQLADATDDYLHMQAHGLFFRPDPVVKHWLEEDDKVRAATSQLSKQLEDEHIRKMLQTLLNRGFTAEEARQAVNQMMKGQAATAVQQGYRDPFPVEQMFNAAYAVRGAALAQSDVSMRQADARAAARSDFDMLTAEEAAKYYEMAGRGLSAKTKGIAQDNLDAYLRGDFRILNKTQLSAVASYTGIKNAQKLKRDDLVTELDKARRNLMHAYEQYGPDLASPLHSSALRGGGIQTIGKAPRTPTRRSAPVSPILRDDSALEFAHMMQEHLRETAEPYPYSSIGSESEGSFLSQRRPVEELLLRFDPAINHGTVEPTPEHIRRIKEGQKAALKPGSLAAKAQANKAIRAGKVREKQRSIREFAINKKR